MKHSVVLAGAAAEEQHSLILRRLVVMWDRERCAASSPAVGHKGKDSSERLRSGRTASRDAAPASGVETSSTTSSITRPSRHAGAVGVDISGAGSGRRARLVRLRLLTREFGYREFMPPSKLGLTARKLAIDGFGDGGYGYVTDELGGI